MPVCPQHYKSKAKLKNANVNLKSIKWISKNDLSVDGRTIICSIIGQSQLVIDLHNSLECGLKQFALTPSGKASRKRM